MPGFSVQHERGPARGHAAREVGHSGKGEQTVSRHRPLRCGVRTSLPLCPAVLPSLPLPALCPFASLSVCLSACVLLSVSCLLSPSLLSLPPVSISPSLSLVCLSVHPSVLPSLGQCINLRTQGPCVHYTLQATSTLSPPGHWRNNKASPGIWETRAVWPGLWSPGHATESSHRERDTVNRKGTYSCVSSHLPFFRPNISPAATDRPLLHLPLMLRCGACYGLLF